MYLIVLVDRKNETEITQIVKEVESPDEGNNFIRLYEPGRHCHICTGYFASACEHIFKFYHTSTVKCMLKLMKLRR